MVGADGGPAGFGRGGWVAIFLGAILAQLLLGPWWLEVPVGDVDPSWQIVLHEAFARRMQFGSEIVWTYGPWGFLWNELYHPDTWGWSLAIRSAWAAVFWAVLASLGGAFFQDRRKSLGFAFALLLLPAYSWDSLVYQGCAMLWFSWFALPSRGGRALSLALVALLCVFALGKFLILLALAAMVAALATSSALAGERRWAAALAGTWMGATLAAWTLAGQSLAGIPAYLSTFFEVASGFGAALTARGSWIEVFYFVAASTSLIGLILASRATLGLPRPRLLLDAAAFCVPLGVAYKHSFTRHDTGHVLIGGTLLVGVSLLVLGWTRLAPAPQLRTWGLRATTAVGAGTVLLLLWSQPVDPLVKTTLPVVKRLPGRLENALHLMTGDRSPLDRAESHAAALAAGEPLGSVEGSVDVYPHAQATVLRHADVQWVTRPVMQSNTAYTPELQALNLAFLRGPDAPQTVLFDIDPSEEHHPADADSLSLLELLERYDVADPLGRFVTLARRDQPRGLVVVPGAQQRIEAGEWVDLPSEGDLAWLRVRADSRPWDGLVGAVWKKRLVRIDVRHADGDVRSWLVSPGVARSGLIVSPSLSGRLDFAAFLAAEPPPSLSRRAVAVRLGLERLPHDEVTRGFSLYLDQVTVPKQAGLTLPGQLGVLSEAVSPPRPKEEHPLWIAGPGGRTVAFAHAPKEFVVGLRPGMSSSARPTGRVEFGLLDGAHRATPPTDGVTFRVTLEFGPREEVLFERHLDPATNPGDRGLQSAEFAIVPGDWQRPGKMPWHAGRPKLVLETETGPTAASDWSYWASVEVR